MAMKFQGGINSLLNNVYEQLKYRIRVTSDDFVDSNGVQKSVLVDDSGSINVKENSFETNQIDSVGDNTYIGMESKSGEWWIKFISAGGNPVPFQHATVVNNPSYLTFTDAWTDRALLAYSDYKDVF